ncbi:hypothetical protein SAMD00079811_31940 [Scytonema sp. HK-05]|uniref:hypothetical protein n=1 Tax=Scytonema sp. HK-05 TaxID=1137095 RepID=UPI000938019F|nr:hypothetical protein [Scytonema sp. HK-05]OKH56661.1 hypothetical protein NIES2130_24085 [Scytonema sp. HK-05]BAY45588.1 hypothetical protein SAMD00079811_31940 [Scytonema sp. HK-05]
MATDYVLFIHGVNTRSQREKPDYADELFELITKYIDTGYELQKIPLYWGNVNKEGEDKLLCKLQSEDGCWQQLWFKQFRQTTLLQFAGDAASYISRTVGSKVVEKLNQDMLKGLKNAGSQDRLHLVTHSWGTVILFDVLFAERWNDENIEGSKYVQEIRRHFYGVEPNAQEGIRVSSIHTMGSPIALFSLLDVVKGEKQAAGAAELTQSQARQRATHDITPNLEALLKNLGKKLNGNKLLWRNYIHPGDPVAWPLNPLIYSLVDGLSQSVNVEDVVTELNGFDYLNLLFSQTPLALLLNGGNAHGSYFTSTKVAQTIVESIEKAAKQPVKAAKQPVLLNVS